MLRKMRYRLALDLGSTSIGWGLIRLDDDEPPNPTALIRSGVRLFGDGREPTNPGEVGASLAVSRRMARQMRRRRDRLLRRKARISAALVQLGFWSEDKAQQKLLVTLDPYELRRKGLDHALTPAEFGRALFHLNQRRGFKSNRKTDKGYSDGGLLKSTIKKLREQLVAEGARSVGEWLAKRHDQRASVRARLRGKGVKDKAYDLYIDRQMISDEFDRLWAKQAEFTPTVFTEDKRFELRDVLLYQRNLKPVTPGKCTLIESEQRALFALPSTQRFRIHQELNNLRILNRLEEVPLNLTQRDTLATLLEKDKATFVQMRKALHLSVGTKFNLEDAKRKHLNGNFTNKALSEPGRFGAVWFSFSEAQQDNIVEKLHNEPDETQLVNWLVKATGVDEARAEQIATANLPEGYGNLSRKAIDLVLPYLRGEVITFDKAVELAGLGSHSALSMSQKTGEVPDALPYYGEALPRHVAFADGEAKNTDPPEKRFGRIANPTVHIGLNELRKVVNKLLARYGHPTEVVIEVARQLKQGQAQRTAEQERQALRQKDNEDFAQKICSLSGFKDKHVGAKDLRLMRLWTELNPGDVANRRCPYTGEQIGMARLFSGEVEIEHILPFSMTLDDSLNNQTVALRRANRDKGNRTPFDAFGHSPTGYDYEKILERAEWMPKDKRKRFAEGALQKWLKEDKDFLPRALNDTAYLSRIAQEYLSWICPHNRVRAIPGRLTAMLRGKFGLDDILGLKGIKNRNDHRHHAVDAAVIGVTDQGLLQRFAAASASAREGQLSRLVENMPLPWPTYREHVVRAIERVVVSHRPDHGHQGALHKAYAYGLRSDGMVAKREMLDGFESVGAVEKANFAGVKLQQAIIEATKGTSGKDFASRLMAFQQETGVRRVRLLKKLRVIPISDEHAGDRHGTDEEGKPLPYKGYDGNSNHCMEIWRAAKGKWKSSVISKFEANQIFRTNSADRLRDPRQTQAGEPLVMRLMLNDVVRMSLDGKLSDLRVATIKTSGEVLFAPLNEANVDSRNRDRLKAKKAQTAQLTDTTDLSDPSDDFAYVSKSAGSLQTALARRITINEIGDIRDPGFNP
jgi:CRISPR-associated endonuclease Csn1